MYDTQFEQKNAEPQQKSDNVSTITSMDAAIGAPYAPLSKSFFVVDPRLSICQGLATQNEISDIHRLRDPFRVGDYPDPYVADVVRAFRLLRGKKRYLEVGIFDRGNLAYMSGLLSEDAHLIGLDIQEDLDRDKLLFDRLKPGQKYESVIGSSRDPASVDRVRELLNGEKLDGIFIDGDHTAYGAMCDYALYEEFIAPDGVILFHDSVWEGSDQYKGVADALAEIDRVDPVYLIDGSNPCRRFLRPLWKDRLWGVVGVVFASDQAWRRA